MNIQKKAQQGFTLIELMIVIAIVGILAAIALPAYQDYTVRAKMAEPLALLGEAKTSVTEYFVTNNSLPTQAASGIRNSPDTDIVASLNLDTTSAAGPLLIVTMQSGIIPAGNGDSFVLSGTTKSGTIEWKCKPTPSGKGSAVTVKYLPANCRG